MSDRKDHKVVMLDTEVAEELCDLVEDKPGEADEELLDEALASLRTAGRHLDNRDQQQVASGEAIAFGASDEEIEAVTTLIVQDKEVGAKTMRSVASSLRSKLKAASKKGRRGNRKGRSRS